MPRICGTAAATSSSASVRAFGVDHAVRVDPSLGLAAVLLEPASVLAKAWDHIERIGRRATWKNRVYDAAH